jgi:hypothetical protein
MAERVQMSALERREPRGPGRRPLLFLFAVMGAPLAWALEIVVDAAFAAYPCAGRGTLEIAAPIGQAGDRAILLAANVLALAAAAAATWLSWQAWVGAEGEEKGVAAGLLAERLTRTRYLATWGLLNGAIFIAALLFDTVMIFGTPPSC